MKKILLLVSVVTLLSSCVVNSSSKHYNTRNLTNRTTCVDPMDVAPNIKVEIVSITDVCGKPVDKLDDGVYIVTLNNNTRVKVIN